MSLLLRRVSAGSAHSLSLSDSVTLTDAEVKTLGLAKTETATLTDAVAKTSVLVQADSVALSDAATKTMGLAESDTVTLGDLETLDLVAPPGGSSTYGSPLVVPIHWPTPPAHDPTRDDELVLILAALT